MKVTDLIGNPRNIDDAINILRVRSVPAPKLTDIKKSISLKEHEVYNKVTRPDIKTYPNPKTDMGGKITDKGEVEWDYVNRIGLAMQNLIIKRAVAFIFGNPVLLKYNADTEAQKKYIKAHEQVLHDNYEPMLNRRAARSTYSYTEVAEYWYPVKAEEGFNDYGFDSKHELKCAIFSPENGDELWPNFDENGRMKYFSRGFERIEGSLTTEYFETYTDEEIVKWKKGSLSTDWVEYSREEVKIGKNPIVYGRQPMHECAEIDDIITRIEKSVSNLGDINDRHTAPKIFINGKVVSFGQKSQANTIIEGGPQTDAKYLSWDNSPESFKSEMEILIRMAYTITQTPDISFDSVKGLGAISGVALKLLFMDAHLKVKDKEEIFIPYLRRRDNIITAYLCEMHNPFKASKVRIDREIVPFMIADDLMQAQVLQIATGAKPFKSQLGGVKEWSGSEGQEEYDQIQKEAKEAAKRDVFEPTF